MLVMLLALLFLSMPGSSHGQCSNTSTPTFRKNQKILLDLLTKNTPLHDGYYYTSVGNNSDQVYGVSQCKATISSDVCAKCLNSSTGSDWLRECPGTQEIDFTKSFCATTISNVNITGVWGNSSTSSFGNEGLDDPLVFSKGFSMMQDLASTVPYQPLMYQAAEIDVGVDGKRYGFAQCGRDLSKLNCQNCLENRLLAHRSYVENRTGWEILGTGCSMWYFNVSDPYKNLGVHTSAYAYSNVPANNQSPPNNRSPANNQSSPGTTSVASGAQRCHVGVGIGTCIWVTTFSILYSNLLFHLS